MCAIRSGEIISHTKSFSVVPTNAWPAMTFGRLTTWLSGHKSSWARCNSRCVPFLRARSSWSIPAHSSCGKGKANTPIFFLTGCRKKKQSCDKVVNKIKRIPTHHNHKKIVDFYYYGGAAIIIKVYRKKLAETISIFR